MIKKLIIIIIFLLVTTIKSNSILIIGASIDSTPPNTITPPSVVSQVSSGTSVAWTAYDPLNTKWIGTRGGVTNLYESTDSGVTWTSINAAPAVTIGLLNTGSNVFIGTQTNIRRSTNGGTTWSNVCTTCSNANVDRNTLIQNPSDGLYWNAGNLNISNSADGITWTLKDTVVGTPNNSCNLETIDARGSTIVAASNETSVPNCDAFIVVSTDNGTTWSQINTISSGNYHNIVHDNTYFYVIKVDGGVSTMLRSVDGVTWSTLGSLPLTVTTFASLYVFYDNVNYSFYLCNAPTSSTQFIIYTSPVGSLSWTTIYTDSAGLSSRPCGNMTRVGDTVYFGVGSSVGRFFKIL